MAAAVNREALRALADAADALARLARALLEDVDAPAPDVRVPLTAAGLEPFGVSAVWLNGCDIQIRGIRGRRYVLRSELDALLDARSSRRARSEPHADSSVRDDALAAVAADLAARKRKRAEESEALAVVQEIAARRARRR